MCGQVLRALVESEADGFFEARLFDNQVVRVQTDRENIGKWVDVKIKESTNWILNGEIVKIYD